MSDAPAGDDPITGEAEVIAGAPLPPSASSPAAGLLELAARAASADRASIWVMHPPAGAGGEISGPPSTAPGGARGSASGGGGRILQREHLYIAGADLHTAGGLLPEDRFPRYFQALDQSDILIVERAAHDPRTAELTESYANPLQIESWIDHRVRAADGTTAVLRLERRRGGPEWTEGETRLVRLLAAVLSGLVPPSESDPPDPYDRFGELLEGSALGVFSVGPDGAILECNARFASLVGSGGPEDLAGRKLPELLELQGDDGSPRGPGEPLDGDFRVRDEGGDARWVYLNTCRASGEEESQIGFALDITDRREREEALREQARLDPLTGLANRRALEEEAPRLLALSARHDRSAALAFLDIRDFKHINDRFGHPAGDRVLVATASRLADQLRESDMGARLGGDEFAVLLSEVDGPDAALDAARRLLELLNQPVETERGNIDVSVRAGLAIYPDHADDLEELIERADEAMYVAAASADGDLPLEIYRPDTAPDFPRLATVTREVQRALAGDEFVLHYQPVMALPEREVAGVEALLRWDHPGRGLLAPGDFLASARSAGHMADIDRWVLTEALPQLARWQEGAGGPEWVAVNLSLETLAEPARLINLVQDRLSGHSLRPRSLVVELDAGDFSLTDPSERSCLSALQDLGVRIAVDCRTSGLDLSSISDVEPEILKIALDLYRERTSKNGGSPAFSEFVAETGGHLIAGFLETEAHFSDACSLPFTLGQGYYLARPRPPSELASIESAEGRGQDPFIDRDEREDERV